jgi:hypothetical protein
MRRTSLWLGVLAVLMLSACGDDGPSGGEGPVNLTVLTLVIDDDTATAQVTMDDTLTFVVKGDTVLDSVPSGPHRFEVVTSLDYLPFSFEHTVSPSRANLAIPRPGTCRVWSPQDAVFCQQGNAFYWLGHTLIACPANDYGEICTAISYPDFLGTTWPDSGQDFQNAYIGEGKLLIGALRDSPGGGEDTLAMAFYPVGDYAPRARIAPVASDSARWRTVLWTDVRHTPFFNLPQRLAETDRFGENFGLQVTTTAYLPPTERNALLLEFDVTNISATDEYRFFHPEEPAGGHTLRDVYLVPMFDFDIGAPGTLDRQGDAEVRDDNVTLFPADSLLMAYDQGFQVARFSPNFRDRPGLVGVQVVESPPGTQARGIFLTDTVSGGRLILDYLPAAREDSSYAIYSAGRAGAQLLRGGCTVLPEALNCGKELGSDVRGGWSIGPIASLAPGETVSLTIAIVLALPAPGTVTPGTIIRPRNDSLTFARPIDPVAADLRARAAAVRALRVP